MEPEDIKFEDGLENKSCDELSLEEWENWIKLIFEDRYWNYE